MQPLDDIHAELLGSLKRYWGYDSFRPVQEGYSNSPYYFPIRPLIVSSYNFHNSSLLVGSPTNTILFF